MPACSSRSSRKRWCATAATSWASSSTPADGRLRRGSRARALLRRLLLGVRGAVLARLDRVVLQELEGDLERLARLLAQLLVRLHLLVRLDGALLVGLRLRLRLGELLAELVALL